VITATRCVCTGCAKKAGPQTHDTILSNLNRFKKDPAAVLLSPIVLMFFAILETFVLLSVSLLLCTSII